MDEVVKGEQKNPEHKVSEDASVQAMSAHLKDLVNDAVQIFSQE